MDVIQDIMTPLFAFNEYAVNTAIYTWRELRFIILF